MQNILITGSSGMLGSEVHSYLNQLKFNLITVKAKEFLSYSFLDWNNFFKFKKIDYVIHCAAFTNVNQCDLVEYYDISKKSIVDKTTVLGEACAKNNIILLYPQSFLVLRDREEPHESFSEDFEPLNRYAELKLLAEKKLLEKIDPSQLIILRLGGFFGGGNNLDKNFIGNFINKLAPDTKKNNKVLQIGNRKWQPTWTRDIALVISFIIKNNFRGGRYQFAGMDNVSFFEIAKMILKINDLKDIQITEVDYQSIDSIHKRPKNIRILNSKEFTNQNNFKWLSLYKNLELYLKEF